MSARSHDVRVGPLPEWVDAPRLLGPESFARRVLEAGRLEAQARLSGGAAAELSARLRGVGFDGVPLEIAVDPPLPRALVRSARLAEARARRGITPGFTLRGVRLDEEGCFSLTPEVLALELGRRATGLRVLDACCGAGGNSIGFARAGCQVTAIELDPKRAADARHNARLYGVSERLQVQVGDARECLPRLTADLLFIDPPWGRDYDKRVVKLADLPLLTELLRWHVRFAHTWVKVPASFVTSDIPHARPEAMFGAASGDLRRVKFVLLSLALPTPSAVQF